jgi:RNA polymerase sigma-70 factor (ECF subfamily)
MSDRRNPSIPHGDTYENTVVPHLDAGRRLAGWLTRNEVDAEDIVQEAALRAFRYFSTFTGGDGRAWFMKIVRNASYEWLGRSRQAVEDPFVEEEHPATAAHLDPEALLLRAADATLVARAMDRLPDRFHQVLALREFEGLSYHELAAATDAPIGTVMSRLSRARAAFRSAVHCELNRPDAAAGIFAATTQ